MSANLIEEAEAALESVRRLYRLQDTYPSSPERSAVIDYEMAKDHAVGFVRPLLDAFYREEKHRKDLQGQLTVAVRDSRYKPTDGTVKAMCDEAQVQSINFASELVALHERQMHGLASKPIDKGYTAWMIELFEPPEMPASRGFLGWWAGPGAGRMIQECRDVDALSLGWTKDPNEAIKFLTKLDAERGARSYCLTSKIHRVTEHCWMPAP